MTTRCNTKAGRWAAALAVALAGLGGNAYALLVGRGPQMVYDAVLDITWTRQAGDGALRSWTDANAWAAGLAIDDPTYGLVGNWRLPHASVSAGVGPISTLLPGPPCTGLGAADEGACRDNEMAYLFYYHLDGDPGDDRTGSPTALGGEVLGGLQPGRYWSGTERQPGVAWVFRFDNGAQLSDGGGVLNLAWAVRAGDVAAAVPEPDTLALLGLGGFGLALARRRRAAR